MAFKKRENALSETALLDRHVFMKCLGFPEEAVERVQIGVVNTWGEVNSAAINLNQVTSAVKSGIWAAGGFPREFVISSVCNAFGGWNYQLVMRDLIAGFIETVVETNLFDGVVFIPICDDVVPAHLMAAARLNLPSILVTGGYVSTNRDQNTEIDPADISTQYFSKLEEGEINQEEYKFIEEIGCAGGGACPVMATANTMAAMTEALGMSLPGNTCMPGADSRLLRLAFKAGMQIVELHKKEIKSNEILTPAAFENAVKVLMGIGGSSNAPIHLQAIAAELDLDIDIDTFNKLSNETPFICDVAPSGTPHHLLRDLDGAGGIQAVMKELSPLLKTDLMTVTGNTLKENLETAKIRDRKIIYPLDKPIEKQGGLIFLRGNLAPDGALVKQTAVPPQMYHHEGPARIFLSDEEVLEALHGNQISPGDTIVVRYNGPKGAPGMRMVYYTVRWLEAMGLIKSVALITDGRFSGYCKGCMIGHISPEATERGPLAVLKEGDIIKIDIPNRQLNVDISPREMENRLKEWNPPKRKHKKGVLALYEQLAQSADKGASLDYKGS
ncbi:MAG: dihydroxy-acid dehydratase [Deltaproteobacteria bacterium]|nr:dihydroxy-acid dehydratase [Deltaproteobacteria bacterium]